MARNMKCTLTVLQRATDDSHQPLLCRPLRSHCPSCRCGPACSFQRSKESAVCAAFTSVSRTGLSRWSEDSKRPINSSAPAALQALYHLPKAGRAQARSASEISATDISTFQQSPQPQSRESPHRSSSVITSTSASSRCGLEASDSTAVIIPNRSCATRRSCCAATLSMPGSGSTSHQCEPGQESALQDARNANRAASTSSACSRLDNPSRLSPTCGIISSC
jgi:hypothetical protein